MGLAKPPAARRWTEEEATGWAEAAATGSAESGAMGWPVFSFF